MKNVDVVIISWARNEELRKITKDGLDTLFESESEIAFHAYIVETNPDVNYNEYNEFKWMHSCTTIHPNSEFGYHKFLNIGRRAGSSPYVVLCNSDLTYEKGWATEIIKVMEELPKFQSASPWCPQTQGSNETHKENVYEGYRVRGELAGWCIFQQRSIYDTINELDERFEFWYCDNDYAIQLHAAGISHGLVANSVVNHHGESLGKTGKTLTSNEQEKITTCQSAIFTKKYSNN